MNFLYLKMFRAPRKSFPSRENYRFGSKLDTQERKRRRLISVNWYCKHTEPLTPIPFSLVSRSMSNKKKKSTGQAAAGTVAIGDDFAAVEPADAPKLPYILDVLARHSALGYHTIKVKDVIDIGVARPVTQSGVDTFKANVRKNAIVRLNNAPLSVVCSQFALVYFLRVVAPFLFFASNNFIFHRAVTCKREFTLQISSSSCRNRTWLLWIPVIPLS